MHEVHIWASPPGKSRWVCSCGESGPRVSYAQAERGRAAHLRGHFRRDRRNNEHRPVSFWVRPDFKLSLRLPVDLTKEEADRLATWIQTLVVKSPEKKEKDQSLQDT